MSKDSSKTSQSRRVYPDKRIQKLDMESLKKLTDRGGPCNECICNLIDPPKPPFDLRNALRNALDTLHMYHDSTTKLIKQFSSKSLAGPSLSKDKDKEKPKAKGKPAKGGKKRNSVGVTSGSHVTTGYELHAISLNTVGG